MSIELKMPALSPTMEEGTLAKWLVKEGDTVSSGDLLAEIETDKATMEFEAIDDGVISKIMVAEGTDGVKVGTVIAMIQGEDDEEEPAKAKSKETDKKPEKEEAGNPEEEAPDEDAKEEPKKEEPSDKAQAKKEPAKDEKSEATSKPAKTGERVIASPLAKRIAADKGVDLTAITGTGPNGRIVKADVENAKASPEAKATGTAPTEEAAAAAPKADSIPDFGIPFEDKKHSNMRKTIAKRLSQSMQDAPHIYLTVDIRLDALLKLRGELNASLEGREIKLSVNDMLIKALALALEAVPSCNVSFASDMMRYYSRSDISVAVSIPGGLITPIIVDAASKSLSKISTEMTELAGKAKDGKLQPAEYQGGTASISNMGMMGIKQFTAVINPPQSMIMAIGAGEKRPYVVDDALQIATVMTATGSFDHRAIDGADGALLMKTFKELVEKPLGLVA